MTCGSKCSNLLLKKFKMSSDLGWSSSSYLYMTSVCQIQKQISKIAGHSTYGHRQSSEDLLTNTTAESKYIPRKPRISINWNHFFHTSIHKFFKTVFYKVNLVSQCSHLKVLLLSKFGSEMGDFKWYRFWASLVCNLMLW